MSALWAQNCFPRPGGCRSLQEGRELSARPLGPGWVAGQPPGRTKASHCSQLLLMPLLLHETQEDCCLSSLTGVWSPILAENSAPVSLVLTDFPPMCQTSSKSCQMESDTPRAITQGHETETLLPPVSARGKSVGLLDLVLGNPLQPPFCK